MLRLEERLKGVRIGLWMGKHDRRCAAQVQTHDTRGCHAMMGLPLALCVACGAGRDLGITAVPDVHGPGLGEVHRQQGGGDQHG